MREDQSVSEMAEEVLARQAKVLVDRTGQAFETALEAVARTDAGRQLRELANGEHGSERALDWQASMARKRAEERHYSWIEGYMQWLQGKEARADYHAFLEEEFAGFKGWTTGPGSQSATALFCCSAWKRADYAWQEVCLGIREALGEGWLGGRGT